MLPPAAAREVSTQAGMGFLLFARASPARAFLRGDSMSVVQLEFPPSSIEAAADTYTQRLWAEARAICPTPLPCPFCGGTDLGVSEIGTLEGPDIVAYECMTDGCYGMAAAAVWNRRAGGAA